MNFHQYAVVVWSDGWCHYRDVDALGRRTYSPVKIINPPASTDKDAGSEWLMTMETSPRIDPVNMLGRRDLYDELAEAMGSDPMDSHEGRLGMARNFATALRMAGSSAAMVDIVRKHVANKS